MEDIGQLRQQWLRNIPIIKQQQIQIKQSQRLTNQYGNKQSFQNILKDYNQQKYSKKTQQKMKKYLQKTGLNLSYDQNNHSDVQQLYVLLRYYLEYPLQQLAQKHIKANIIGEHDIVLPQIFKYQQTKQLQSSISRHSDYEQHYNQQYEKQFKNVEQRQLCECCSLPISKTQNQFSFFRLPSLSMHNLGQSIYLFFVTQIMILACLTIMFLVHCIYALIVNRQISKNYWLYFQAMQMIPDSDQLNVFSFIASFGIGPFIQYQYYKNINSHVIIECLGTSVLFIWFVFFLVIKIYFLKKYTSSQTLASTFTLLFNNCPKNISLETLQKTIDDYLIQQMSTKDYKIYFRIKQQVLDLKIKRLSQRYRTSKSQGQISLQSQQIQNHSNNIRKGIIQKINEPRYLYYKNYCPSPCTPFCFNLFCCFNKFCCCQKDQKQKQLYQKRVQLENLIKYRLINESFDKHQIYNTFKSRLLLYKNYRTTLNQSIQQNCEEQIKTIHSRQQQQKQKYNPLFITFTNRWILQKFLYFHEKHPFQYTVNNKADVQIALEPTDYIWQNMGQPTLHIVGRVIGSIVITLAILAGSFFFLILMEYQDNIGTFKINILFPVIISFSLKIFDIFLENVLYYMSKLQRHKSYTNQQLRISLKTTLVLLIQSIVLPLLFSRLINQNIFGRYGLTYIVLSSSVLNILQDLFWRIIDVQHPFQRFISLFTPQHLVRLKYTQKSYNQAMLDYKTVQFEIGYEYIDVVRTFLFTCFFVPLQPWLCLFSMVNCIIMFYGRQWYLLRCKRPIPYGRRIHEAMHKFLMFGPLLYIGGVYYFTSFASYYNPINIQNLIGLCIAIMFIVVQLVIFGLKKNRNITSFQNKFYQQWAFNILCDYDMANPSTNAVGRVLKCQQNSQLGNFSLSNSFITDKIPTFFLKKQTSK